MVAYLSLTYKKGISVQYVMPTTLKMKSLLVTWKTQTVISKLRVKSSS